MVQDGTPMPSVISTYAKSDGPHQDKPGWRFWKRRRYVVATMGFFGFFMIYALRVNLSVAIVAMTEKKNMTLENGTTIYEGEFQWNFSTRLHILSSFFYGYIATQIVGGLLAVHFGGKRLYGIGVGVSALLTLATPWAARKNVRVLVLMRAAMGLFEGVTYPCIHAVWAQWAPPLERSRLATIAFTGSYAGTVVSMPVCALLAEWFGWASIFYVFGILGIIWFVFWILLISETPSKDPWISDSELRYIKESLGDNSQKEVKIPLCSIISSPPVWSIVVAHFSENWGFYTLLTQLPIYMKDVLNFDLAATGFMSALPYLAMAIMLPLSGQLADWLLVKGIYNVTDVRKLCNCGAFLSQMVFMIATAFASSATIAVICLTMSVGLGAFAWAGFSVNHLDIAPLHASLLMGFSNTIATLPGIFSPYLTSFIVTNGTKEEWRYVFFVAAFIYLFGSLFYGTLASGELQSWAKESETLKSKHQSDSHSTQGGISNSGFQYDETTGMVHRNVTEEFSSL